MRWCSWSGHYRPSPFLFSVALKYQSVTIFDVGLFFEREKTSGTQGNLFYNLEYFTTHDFLPA
jgi:hypothetical protein